MRLGYIGHNTIDYKGTKWEVAPSYEENWHRATWNGRGYYDKERDKYVQLPRKTRKNGKNN